MQTQSFALLASLIFFTSYSGQVKTNVTINNSVEQKAITKGTPTLVKTQGSNQFHNVHCGLLDKAGNLWFGTTGEGVYRYDGKLFTQYTVKDGLSSNTIWSVLEDKTGNIWFGTADGVSRYDGKQFTHVPIAVEHDKFLPGNSPGNASSVKNAVWSIMQDKAGKLWFGTTDGVYCYNELLSTGEMTGFTFFLDNIINKNNLHLKTIEAIVEDKNGNIWFGSSAGEGVSRFDGKSLVCLTPINFGRVMSGIEDKNGNLWFGTAIHGCVFYDGKSFVSVTKNEGIDTWVYSVVEDKNGNIWSVTELGSGEFDEDGGVWRLDAKSLPAGHAGFTHFTKKDGLIHNGVFCTVEDKEGNLWFGTRNTGLCRFDGKTFTKFSE